MYCSDKITLRRSDRKAAVSDDNFYILLYQAQASWANGVKSDILRV